MRQCGAPACLHHAWVAGSAGLVSCRTRMNLPCTCMNLYELSCSPLYQYPSPLHNPNLIGDMPIAHEGRSQATMMSKMKMRCGARGADTVAPSAHMPVRRTARGRREQGRDDLINNRTLTDGHRTIRTPGGAMTANARHACKKRDMFLHAVSHRSIRKVTNHLLHESTTVYHGPSPSRLRCLLFSPSPSAAPALF